MHSAWTAGRWPAPAPRLATGAGAVEVPRAGLGHGDAGVREPAAGLRRRDAVPGLQLPGALSAGSETSVGSNPGPKEKFQ